MLLCQFLGLNLKRHEISISCLLEHSFLEPSLHALRKPKHLCGKAHMQRTVPGLLLTPSSAMWISCVGVGFPSFSRTSQLPLCASETILPAESCSPYRFRSKINDCHCIAKFRLKLKKVGKSTRPFRYDLNQIPYDYTVEVRNRFKGLDLIDRVSDELWMKICDIVQETGIKTIPKKKNAKKQNGCLWRPSK